jgi:hypothetical protein
MAKTIPPNSIKKIIEKKSFEEVNFGEAIFWGVG